MLVTEELEICLPNMVERKLTESSAMSLKNP